MKGLYPISRVGLGSCLAAFRIPLVIIMALSRYTPICEAGPPRRQDRCGTWTTPSSEPGGRAPRRRTRTKGCRAHRPDRAGRANSETVRAARRLTIEVTVQL
jgi:hypothetical protein